MVDKRRATWVALEGVRDDMRECVKSDAALWTVLNTNQKTGSNIMHGFPVKRDVMKEAMNSFLKFLVQYDQGEILLDGGRHHEDDVKKMVAKYVLRRDGVAKWTDLAADIEGIES